MNDQKAKALDLFLLMFNLSQLTVEEKIVGVFVEALKEIWSDTSVSYHPSKTDDEYNVIEIAISNSHYGFIKFDALTDLKIDEQDLLHNAVAMLAVILKKNEQDKLLADDKLHLQKLVDDKVNAIKESEERFKNVFEHLVTGLSITTIDGKMKANKALHQFLGYSEDELSTLTWKDITHTDDIESTQKVMDLFIAGEEVAASWEKRYIHKNGSTLWANISSKLQRDNEGKPLYFITSIHDMTERKKTEAALRESEERYRAMMEQATDAIFVHNETGRILDANLKACQNLGYSLEELLSKSIGDIDPNAIQTKNQTFWRKILAGRQSTFESHQMRKDGSFIPVEVTLGSVRLPLGPAILSIARDITERKRFETEQFQLLDIIENSLNEIYVFDSSTLRFEYVNQGALKNIGYSFSEMQNLTPVDIKPEYTEEVFREIIQPLMKQEKGNLVFETIHRRKNGTDYPVEIHLQLHIKKDKSLFFAIINDITERKRWENEIRRLNEDLEQKIDERTSELRESITRLEELNRVFVDRELKMMKLKERIAELERK
jgi:PAS domain S-box-containing protein